MVDVREVIIIADSHGSHAYRVEFNSNGVRKRRFITVAEKDKLEKLIADKDYAGIDLFCYNIA